jgi:GntR family histidine utilization transcriptional repressor
MATQPSGRIAGSPSLHSQILADVEQRIFSGQWPPGYRIPFEHELAQRYGCSRMTVSKALTQLANAGLIERRRKAGSFVKRPHGQSAALEINDVADEVAALGLPYAYVILSRRRRRATRADRERIGVGADDDVLAIVCRHDAAGRPFCLEDRLISLAAAPDAAKERFADLAPGAWLVARIPWTNAEHRISAAAADGAVAAALALAKGEPCLAIERRTWIGDRAVTQVRFTYPAAEHELVARFAPAKS